MQPNYRLLLFGVLFLCFGAPVLAQSESEPNDNFATADTVAENVNTSGAVSNSDLFDYFYTVLPDDGTIKLKFNYTGTDPGNNSDFRVTVYDQSQNAIPGASFIRLNLTDGTNYTDSLMIYCRAADTVYFRFEIFSGSGSAGYDFDYNLDVPGANDSEPNNTFATSQSVNEDITYHGRLGFLSNQADLQDHFVTELVDDGTVKLKFNYTATSGGNATDIIFNVYNKNQTSIGSFSRNNLTAGFTYTDSIMVYCRAADTLFFRFYVYGNTGCLIYDFEYDLEVPGPNDPEPNDNLNASSEVFENTTYQGRLGYTSISQDLEDFYYTVLTDDGTVKLKFDYTATNAFNSTDILFRAYNKNGVQIGAFSRNNLTTGFTYTDSIMLFCRSADTIYYSFFVYGNSGCLVYNFNYDVEVPGPNDPEPNDSLQTGSEVFEDINYQGRLGYGSISQDLNDYYYTVLQDDGTVKLSFNYTATNNSNSTDVLFQVLNKNGVQIGVFSHNNLIVDSTYSDSIMVYCRAADTIYYRFFVYGGSGCLIYDFDYDLEIPGPNDPEPNDDFAFSSQVSENTSYEGRLGYMSINQDINDYYYAVLPDDGTLKLYFNYKATNNSNTTDIDFYVYNKNQVQIGVHTHNNLTAGVTYTDSMQVYCRAADTVYFRFFMHGGSGCLVYDFNYDLQPHGLPDAEPNDNLNEANVISLNTTYNGRLGFTSVAQDLNDYYLLELPEDGALKLNFDFQAHTPLSTTDMQINIRNKAGAVLQNYSVNNFNPNVLISDTIIEYCRAADTVFIQFLVLGGSGCYTYSFDAGLLSSGPSDVEPNDILAEAQPINLTDPTNGTIGHTSVSRDVTDYFRFVNTGYSEINILVDYTNTAESANTTDVYFTLLNENGASIESHSHINIPLGSARDSFLLTCPALDTFYFRVNVGNGCLGYTLHFDNEWGTYYADNDNDNYGDPSDTVFSCSGPPPGYIADSSDCNDADSTVNPGAPEICDGVDNNCDGNIDEGIYTTSNIPAAICAGDSILIGGLYRMIAATYIDTTIILDGCDSISVVTLTVNPNRDSTLAPMAMCEGDSMLIFGIYQRMAGNYSDTLQTVNGCDSIVYKELIVNSVDTTYQSGTTTDPQMAGTFDTTYTNQNGCDSVVITTITLIGTPCTNDSTTVNAVTCDSTLAGTAMVSYPKTDGCDSVVTTITTFDPGSTTALPAISICDGESTLIFGQARSAAGTYYDTLQNVNGCDSILSMQLNIKPTYSTHIFPPIFVCNDDVAIIFGIPRGPAGTYYDTLSAVNGCDSILSRDLVRSGSNDTLLPVTICEGDSAKIGSTYYTQPGVYEEHCEFIPHSPCEDCYYRELIVKPRPISNIAQMICAGDSVIAGGGYQTTSGVYYDTLMAANGCDSLVVTTVTVKPNSAGNAMAMICDGDSILLGGIYRKTAGMYNNTLNSANGCDSILTTILTVKPNVTVSTTDSICPGDSVLLGGAYRSLPGTFTDLYPAANGCDSTVITTLYLKDSLDCPVDSGSAPLVCVSDSGWSLSTVVTIAGSNLYPWPGVMGVPSAATFTLPVEVGQPYPWEHIFTVAGSEVITAEAGVRYYRKTFQLSDPTGIKARFRMYVDDDMQIFINGHWVALEDDMGPFNYRTINHDLQFNGDGTYTNGNMGGDPFDAVTTADMDTVFKAGTNELILAIRNRTSKPDRGGFSFRMDLDKGAVVPKSAPLVRGKTAKGIDVFPNPTDGLLRVTLLSPTTYARLQLFDFSGKLMQEQGFTGETELDLSGYSQGVYLVKVVSADKTFTQKVVKD